MAGVASLDISINGNSAGLSRELNKANRAVSRFGNDARRELRNVALAFTALAASAGVVITSLANFGDEIAKQARNVGFSVTAFQQWSLAFEQADINQQTFVKSVLQVNRVLGEAQQGLSTATRAFMQLGLSVDELVNLSPEERFATVVEALRRIEDPTLRAALANQVLGRSWRDLGTVLELGINEVLSASEGLAVVTESATDASERFNDAQVQISQTIRASALNALAPVLNVISAGLETLAQNGRLVGAIMAGTAAALGAIAAVQVIRGINAIVVAFRTLRTVLMGVAFFTALSTAGISTLAGAAAFATAAGAYYLLADSAEAAGTSVQTTNEAIVGTAGALEQLDNQVKGTLSDYNQIITDARVRSGQITREFVQQERILMELNTLLEQGVITQQMYAQGVALVNESYMEQMETIAELDTSFQQVGRTIQSELRDTLVDAFETGRLSASSFFDAITSQILNVAANALTNNILGSLFGGGGFGFLGFNQGGVVPNIPGVSRPGVDSVPALLTPGETVIPAGQSAQSVTVNFNITGDVSRQTLAVIERSATDVANIVQSNLEERGIV